MKAVPSATDPRSDDNEGSIVRDDKIVARCTAAGASSTPASEMRRHSMANGLGERRILEWKAERSDAKRKQGNVREKVLAGPYAQ